MKVICTINLKGGVGKTISTVNIGHILTVVHGKRVLLVDNDKQGNTSKFFGLHSDDLPSISDVLTVKDYPILGAVRKTEYEGLDVLPANMSLLYANKQILLDCSRPQQTRLAKALHAVEDKYDYVIIDNAPDLNMSTVNALVACDDVLIPIKIDKFSFDGLEQLKEQIEETREFNSNIRIAGCFITMYQRNGVNTQGEQHLNTRMGIPMFKTVIRKTVKVDETTFTGKPILAYSKNSTAAQDYVALVEEYLSLKGGNTNVW
jgi:chromosome partitioning protein